MSHDTRRDKNVARIMREIEAGGQAISKKFDKATMAQAKYLANLYGTSDKVIATVRAQAGLADVADAMTQLAATEPVSKAIVDTPFRHGAK